MNLDKVLSIYKLGPKLSCSAVHINVLYTGVRGKEGVKKRTGTSFKEMRLVPRAKEASWWEGVVQCHV